LARRAAGRSAEKVETSTAEALTSSLVEGLGLRPRTFDL
jgi:hypothetical protein